MILRAIHLSLILFFFSQLSLSAMNLDIRKGYKRSYARRLINHYKKRNYTKAVEFLDKVMAEEMDEKSRQCFSALKIVAIGCQKGREQEALEQVSTLKDEALQGYCRYKILARNGKLDVIADKYLDEDISLWPVELQLEGYMIRIKVYLLKLNKKKPALADCKKALSFKKLGGRTRINLYLTMCRIVEDDDPEAAKQYFKEAHSYFLSNMTRHLTSKAYYSLIWEWAQLLVKLNEYREALEVLNRYNGKNNPKELKKVLAVKAELYGKVGDTDNQKLYESYLRNYLNNLEKSGGKSVTE